MRPGIMELALLLPLVLIGIVVAGLGYFFYQRSKGK